MYYDQYQKILSFAIRIIHFKKIVAITSAYKVVIITCEDGIAITVFCIYLPLLSILYLK
jgi:hypothetical protein